MVQVALGQRKRLSREPSEKEWTEIYATSKTQTVVGVVFLALEKLNEEGQRPPVALLYEWIALSEQIKQRNVLLNQRCIELMKMFADVGFESCILKGQGNALIYPEPLLRMPGDIDIWVEGDRNKIIEFCQLKAQGCEELYHHIQFPIWADIDVEVHFMPSYSFVPKYTKRTKRYFEVFQREEIDGKGLISEEYKMYVPSKEINLVFQMSHIARHFFYGGVGLRQLMDYYYLLKSKSVWKKDEVAGTLRNLSLYKFAGAVMWVLKEAFGAEEELLIVPVDEKRGKLLLDEIMKGGNFGQYDKRVSWKLRKKSVTISIIARNIRMLWLFPEEALWAPVMGAWNYLKYMKY